MTKVEVAEVESRLGKFCVIKLSQIVLITPCDTRMQIIRVVAEKEKTAHEIAEATKTAYSTVMDHMDLLEKVGLVESFLKREGGRRRIYFRVREKLSEEVLASAVK